MLVDLVKSAGWHSFLCLWRQFIFCQQFGAITAQGL